MEAGLGFADIENIDKRYPPLMTDTCKTEILRRINEFGGDCDFFEFGSGGSTLFFEKYCKSFTSVEHDKAWYEKIKIELMEKKLDVGYQFAKVADRVDPALTGGNPPGKKQIFIDYYNYCTSINSCENKIYDIVFIDGVARQYCLYTSLLNTSEKSYVIIHDYCLGKTDYSDEEFHPEIFLKYYELLLTSDSSGEGRGNEMTILKPKAEYDKVQLKKFIENLNKKETPL
jgi:hypothetical protein